MGPGMPEHEECEIALRKHKDRLLGQRNVVGVAIGKKLVGGEETDELCVTVFVTKKVPEEELKARDVVPKELEGVRTDVIETGEIVAYARTDRLRPCPPGVSIGHVRVTAGTFGCVVRDPAHESLILSNNHVLADSNRGALGDAILQPGPSDGGTLEDVLARLIRFVPIAFDESRGWRTVTRFLAAVLGALARLVGRRSRLADALSPAGSNLVDAAVGLPDRDEDLGTAIVDLGPPQGVHEPAVGLHVHKSGRTTGTTEGRITHVGATLRVGYGPGRTATFEDQLVISDGRFSAPGDSGSAIVAVEDGQVKLVGLLFGGGATVTVANRIDHVFELLGVTL